MVCAAAFSLILVCCSSSGLLSLLLLECPAGTELCAAGPWARKTALLQGLKSEIPCSDNAQKPLSISAVGFSLNPLLGFSSCYRENF